jgi:AcrR family transcriptional regulator
MTAAVKTKADDRMVGLAAFTQRRKRESREQLLDAATRLFHDKGYYSVSVDDIAGLAGVSRMTFYRHFKSRAAILMELFERNSEAVFPQLFSIGDQDYRDPATVRAWIEGIFDADWPGRQILRAIAQAVRMDREFVQAAQNFIGGFVAGLGRKIPAFAADPDGPDRKQWLDGWLVAYQILDQSNQATLDMGLGRDPLVIELLAERFVEFVTREP